MEVIYSKAWGIDVHKTFIVAVICDFTGKKLNTQKNAFQLLIKTLFNSEIGYSKTTVKMYAWNLLVNTIFLYTMH